jgi:hypothetical protein
MSKVSEKILAETNGNRGGVIHKIRAPIKHRHRMVLKHMSEGATMTGAMVATGYTPSSASNTVALQNTRSWQALMEEQLPDSLLALRHRELLDKREVHTRYIGKGKRGRFESVDLGPDVASVARGLELAYKIKGKAREEGAPPKVNTYNLFFNDSVQKEVRAFEDSLKITLGAHAIEGRLPDFYVPTTPSGSPEKIISTESELLDKSENYNVIDVEHGSTEIISSQPADGGPQPDTSGTEGPDAGPTPSDSQQDGGDTSADTGERERSLPAGHDGGGVRPVSEGGDGGMEGVL